MRSFYKIFSAAVVLAVSYALFAQDAESEKKRPKNLRFHSGTVVAAELLPETPAIPVKVANVSPFEPPSKVTSDVAYASVVVRLDQGRSISIYDYSLQNARKTDFKCIGVREGEDAFDANKWEFTTTSPEKLYTLLFRVELPPANEKCEYSIHFNLNKNMSEDILLPFVKIDRPFTAPSKIPSDGIIGIDPVKEEAIKAEEEKKKDEVK